VAYGIPVVLLAALGIGGYYGYGWYQDRRAKALEAEKNAAAQAQSISNQQATAESAQAAANAVAPPFWTLDLDSVKMPQGRVNGMISGTNFIPDIVRIDAIGGVPVLRLIQGQILSPEREVLIYVHLKAGEKLGGQTLTISKDMKTGIPPITKVWKANPSVPLQSKTFQSGYVLKLQLEQATRETTNTVVPGTIYLALPDAEQSVVAGDFQALVGPALAPAVALAPAPAVPPVETAHKKKKKGA
jgi:hypothetical protein